MMTEGNAGANQCAIESGAGRNAQATAIQLCAIAAAGGEFFTSYRIIDDSMFQFAFEKAADGNSVVGNAADKIGGSIERINDPDVITFAIAATAFLSEETMFRVGA